MAPEPRGADAVTDGPDTISTLDSRDEVGARDRVIGQLDFEIAAIHTQETRQGWTTWSIVAAVATLLWSILSLLGGTRVHWPTVCIMIGLASAAGQVAWALCGVSDPASADDRIGYADRTFHRARPFLIGLIAHFALLTLALWNSPLVQGWTSLVVRAYLVQNHVTLALTLAISYVHIPLPLTPRRSHWSWAGSVAFQAMPIAAVAALLRLLVRVPWTYDEVRVGVLVTASSILVIQLLRSRMVAYMVPQLVGLRRRLALGATTTAAGAHELDLILNGLTVAEELRPYAAKTLAAYGRAQAALSTAEDVNTQYLTATVALCRQMAASQAGDALHGVEHSVEEWGRQIEENEKLREAAVGELWPPVTEAISAALRETETLAWRASLLERASPVGYRNATHLVSAVDSALEQLRDQVTTVHERAKAANARAIAELGRIRAGLLLQQSTQGQERLRVAQHRGTGPDEADRLSASEAGSGED